MIYRGLVWFDQIRGRIPVPSWHVPQPLAYRCRTKNRRTLGWGGFHSFVVDATISWVDALRLAFVRTHRVWRNNILFVYLFLKLHTFQLLWSTSGCNLLLNRVVRSQFLCGRGGSGLYSGCIALFVLYLSLVDLIQCSIRLPFWHICVYSTHCRQFGCQLGVCRTTNRRFCQVRSVYHLHRIPNAYRTTRL